MQILALILLAAVAQEKAGKSIQQRAAEKFPGKEAQVFKEHPQFLALLRKDGDLRATLGMSAEQTKEAEAAYQKIAAETTAGLEKLKEQPEDKRVDAYVRIFEDSMKAHRPAAKKILNASQMAELERIVAERATKRTGPPGKAPR